MTMTKSDARWIAAFPFIGTVVVLAVMSPSWFAGAAGVCVVIFLLARIDWWQRFYVLTLVLMMGAVSTIAPLLAVAEYGRYAAAGALLVITWVATRKTAPAINSPLHKRTLIFLWITVVVATLSILWSVDRTQSALQVIALAILVGIFQLLSTRRWMKRDLMVKDFSVMFHTLTFGFLACLAALAVGLPGARAFGGTADTAGRFQGVFNNPNMLALLSAIAIPLGIGIWNERRKFWRLAQVGIPCSVLILTESRTAIVAAGAAVVWMIMRSGALSVAKFGYAALIGVIVVLASGIDLIGTAFARFGSLEGGDILNTRTEAWAAAINLVQIQPLGYGWQAGRQLFESLQGSAGFTFTRTSVHNSYLQVILELGVMGIVPLLYLVFALGLVALRGRITGLESGFVGIITAGLIIQFTESAIFGTGQAYPYVFWFALAGALTVYRPIAKKERSSAYKGLPSHYHHLAVRREREAVKTKAVSSAQN